jgi:DNA-binding beta-propeller fold protein YncE
VNLTLEARNQHYNQNPTNAKDVFEKSINSPKSAVFTPDQKKLYVHSLEGYSTTVYDGTTWKKQKVITHKFGKHNDSLFKNSEYTVFDYKYRKKDGKGNQEAKERVNHNEFSGKPVESCLSHNGKYLWVTYYRRSYDKNAESPSAVAIIDTELDEIVRVMPTGPLPKMIACSPNNKYIAVTHWGDNTVGIIDIQSDNVMEFKYIKHCIVDYRAKLDFNSTEVVNRDNSCGNCLRGTLFTPDGNFLIVGKMGGSGGLMIFDTRDFSSLGTVKGLKRNVRHLIINKEDLYVSTNSSGYVQKCNWKDLTKFRIENEGSSVIFSEWKNVYVGIGARTISVSDDGKYVYVAISNECKIKVIRTSDMSVVATIDADSYPVGMALSPDQKHLVVTSQGKKSSGGNSVMIFEITLK